MDIKKEDTNNYAIVIGNGHFNSLGVARSLGEKGVPVIFINLSENGGAQDSKYTIKTFHIKNTEEICETIDKIISEFGGKPVLFPCSDADALYLDMHYAELKEKTHCPNLNGQADFFMNKENMCSLAKDVGLIVPETLSVCVDDEGKKQLLNFDLPCIIKPLKSVDGPKSDIAVCKKQEELNAVVDVFWGKDSRYCGLLVQKYIEGEEERSVDIAGYKIRGEKSVLLAQVDKIREFPQKCGSTTFAVVKPSINAVDAEQLDLLLEKMDFEGLFDFDIKIVDGKPYFMEVNLRNGAIGYGYTAAGFNIPSLYYQSKLNLDTESVHMKEITLMCERDDLNYVLSKKLSPFRWLKDVINTDVMMQYNKRDKKPFNSLYGRAVGLVFGLLARNSA